MAGASDLRAAGGTLAGGSARADGRPARRAIAAVLGATLLFSVRLAEAGGLVDDFRAALAFDPTWQSAQAIRDAGVEARAQGLAGLLPQVSLGASQGKATTDSTQVVSGASSTSHYDTFNYSLQVRQPIYRARAIATYAQGKAQEAYAEENLKAARQDLALRVVSAYGEWADARAAVDATEVRVAAAEVLLHTAQRNLQGGDVTRVDVETARSTLAQSQARRSDAQGQLQAAMLAWRQITGRDGPRAQEPRVSSAAARRLKLDPARLDEIQAAAVASNGQIVALEHAVQSAREETRKARGDHLPAVDLYATRTRSQSDNDFSINQRFDTTRYGVQVNVPIYSGGAIDSTVRQAHANLRRAENELQAAKLKLRLQVERDWHALTAARASAEAAERQIAAATLATRAARLGTEAGSATRADEVTALSQQADGQRDLGQANARILVLWARLNAAMNRLDEETLVQADATLTATALAASDAIR